MHVNGKFSSRFACLLNFLSFYCDNGSRSGSGINTCLICWWCQEGFLVIIASVLQKKSPLYPFHKEVKQMFFCYYFKNS